MIAMSHEFFSRLPNFVALWLPQRAPVWNETATFPITGLLRERHPTHNLLRGDPSLTVRPSVSMANRGY